jgi:EAL domain-containing protein (putative c-di-GMP-specific phosphodiesterase class I)
LCEPQFTEKIIAIAQKYDLSFSCLAVEILEDKNVTGEARKQMIDNLSALKEKGISILLDDFGSGYTTFSDLQSLDISVVKIDKTITQNSVTDTGFIILKNIIRTSHDIGFRTLCEGVETKEQEEAAIKAGCDFLQGFYYYKPMPVAQLEKVFNENSGGV